MSATFTLTRKTVFGLLAAGLLSATALTTSMIVAPPLEVRAESQVAIDPTKGFADLVDRVMPAVISVEVKYANAADREGEAAPREQQFEEFFNQFPQFRNQLPPGFEHRRPRGGAAMGSGFLISADGYAVTNNHVVQDADEVTVKIQGGTELKAEVIGTDPKTDLALIKIKSDKPFTFVNFAQAPARVGDIVMAVGNPFGLGGSVTTGIVSARGRDIGSGPYDDFLQIDASINKGNSGGPAFNLQGEVIGVNTAIFSPSGGSVGIGFAIPAEITQDVIASLKESGSVTRGWLGVQIQPVTEEIAESLGLASAKGAIVSDVTEDSPALAAGFKPGDTILKADGTDISDARDLSKKVARFAPGKSVNVDIVRDGKPMTVTVKIGTMPNDKRMASRGGNQDSADLASLGLKLGPAEDGAGVKIVEVAPNSVADEQGLKPGDIILEVAGNDVNGPSDVKNALKDAGKSRVLMLVRSGENQRFLALPLAKG
ncbi:MAG: Do family serine endopeptidase [Aestuariivirga sp.]